MNIIDFILSLFTNKKTKTSPIMPEDKTKEIIIKILNVFETGKPNTIYDKIYIYKDGPNQKAQITLARGYTECGGALWKVLEKYKAKGGMYGDTLLSYKSQSCKEILPNTPKFKNLIISAAQNEQAMRDAQDEVYDELYYAKGEKWAKDNGFTKPLSKLVIQDSFLHSGSILDFLRQRFAAKPPANGGKEEEWIKQYVDARDSWLRNHSNKLLRNTVYRTQFLKDQINNNNWNLDKFPIYPNGVKIS